MKLGKLFCTLLLAGALTVIGCGDDGGGSGGTTGTGGMTGTGGTSGAEDCNTGECVNDATRRTACETAIAACMIGPPAIEDECIQAAIADACLDQTNPM